MKKNMLIFLAFSIMLVSMLFGCNNENKSEVIFLDDLIQCDILESGDRFGFSLKYLYSGNTPKVEFISFDNSNYDAYLKEMYDETFDSIREQEYKGYKCGMLGFKLDTKMMPDDSEINIEKIRFSINGIEQVVDVRGKIKYKKIKNEGSIYDCDSVYATSVPILAASLCTDLQGISFSYSAESIVNIEKFEFSNYINIKESTVYVDEKRAGTIENAFPIELNKGQSIRIEIDGDFGKFSAFSDYYMNSLLYYSSEDEGERILKDFFAVQAISNWENAKLVIDSIVEK